MNTTGLYISAKNRHRSTGEHWYAARRPQLPVLVHHNFAAHEHCYHNFDTPTLVQTSMGTTRPRVRWTELPRQLWAAVFELVRPEIADFCNDYEVQEFGDYLQPFYELRRVCTTFRQIFEEHSELYFVLFLARQPNGPGLEAMKNWIQHHGGKIEVFAAACASPWLEAALTALLILRSAESGLRVASVALEFMTPAAMPLLGCMTSISRCFLQFSTINHAPNQVSLQALENLPNLTSLELLRAHASQMRAAKHLTFLSLDNSTVDCSGQAPFVSTLLDLRIMDSTLTILSGVAACCSLQSLVCGNGCVLAATSAEKLDFRSAHAVCMPSGLSGLRALTCLDLYHNGDEEELHLGCVSTLRTLRDLHISCRVRRLNFSSGLEMLTNLSRLDIGSTHADGEMIVQIDWRKLVALHFLRVRRCVSSGHCFRDIACLKALRSVYLLDLIQSDLATTIEIGMLGHKLGIKRPEVFFQVSKTVGLNVFQHM